MKEKVLVVAGGMADAIRPEGLARLK